MPEASTQQAMDLQRAGRLDDAEAIYQQLLRDQPAAAIKIYLPVTLVKGDSI